MVKYSKAFAVASSVLRPRSASAMLPDHDLTLIIPAFNEEQRLPQTLTSVAEIMNGWSLDYRVLVVDDGSRDRTAKLTGNLGARFSTLRQPRQAGKGAAVRAGMLQATGAVVAFTDADLPFDLAALQQAYTRIRSGQCDVICGARDAAESSARVKRSWGRQAASWTFRTIVRRLLALPVTDTQCGLKVFSQRAAREIFSRTTINGFAFDVELLFIAAQLGFKCESVPVVQLNEYASTISLRRHAWPMLREVLGIYQRSLRGAYDFASPAKQAFELGEIRRAA